MSIPRGLFVLVAVTLVAGRAQGQAYAFTTHSTVEKHRDTVYWVRSTAAKKPDTVVYLMRRDSTVRLLRPAPERELPEPLAKHFRFIYNEARESDAVFEKIRQMPRQP